MMIDCRQVRQLLPLWVGQDLPDVCSSKEVANHLEECRDCDRQRKSLQSSLEFLQGSSSETLSVEAHRHSVWPQLSVRIADWESHQNRDRFNGWLPATVMALAVALMLAVSIPSILQEIFKGNPNENFADLFYSDTDLKSFRTPDEERPLPPRFVPVDHRPNQW